MPSEEEFCQREIEYIDWAFAAEQAPCAWDAKKYLDAVDYIPDPRHQKWLNNRITAWWEENGGKDLNAIAEEDEKALLQSAAGDPDPDLPVFELPDFKDLGDFF